MVAVRIVMTGRVQGVFFRASAKRKAEELRVTGWVRNCDDGSVEIHAEGDPAAIVALREWCERGPDEAHVDTVMVSEADDEGFTNFSIL